MLTARLVFVWTSWINFGFYSRYFYRTYAWSTYPDFRDSSRD